MPEGSRDPGTVLPDTSSLMHGALFHWAMPSPQIQHIQMQSGGICSSIDWENTDTHSAAEMSKGCTWQGQMDGWAGVSPEGRHIIQALSVVAFPSTLLPCVLGLSMMPAPWTSLWMSQVRPFALSLLGTVPEFPWPGQCRLALASLLQAMWGRTWNTLLSSCFWKASLSLNIPRLFIFPGSSPVHISKRRRGYHPAKLLTDLSLGAQGSRPSCGWPRTELLTRTGTVRTCEWNTKQRSERYAEIYGVFQTTGSYKVWFQSLCEWSKRAGYHRQLCGNWLLDWFHLSRIIFYVPWAASVSQCPCSLCPPPQARSPRQPSEGART